MRDDSERLPAAADDILVATLILAQEVQHPMLKTLVDRVYYIDQILRRRPRPKDRRQIPIVRSVK